MRPFALASALLFILLAVPAVARADAALQEARLIRLLWESLRAILAIAAASALVLWSWRAA